MVITPAYIREYEFKGDEGSLYNPLRSEGVNKRVNAKNICLESKRQSNAIGLFESWISFSENFSDSKNFWDYEYSDLFRYVNLS